MFLEDGVNNVYPRGIDTMKETRWEDSFQNEMLSSSWQSYNVTRVTALDFRELIAIFSKAETDKVSQCPPQKSEGDTMHTYTKVSPPVSPVPSQSSPFIERRKESPDGQGQRLSATAKRQKYLKRLLKFRQMDFEYAIWQMIYLFVSPQKVYRNFQYRKYTKDQWARDDPAFLVLLSFWLCVSSIGFSLVLGLTILQFFKFLIWVVLIDCVGVGLLIATLFWFITNRYMISAPPRGQDVEWGYAFDVHLNAFFPLLMILHLFQLIFLNLFITHPHNFLSTFFGNSLWLLALGYYVYITFLGYSALPFVKNTRALLYPITGIILIYILSLILGWNFNTGLCYFYERRVVNIL